MLSRRGVYRVFFQVWLLADFTAASPPNVALSGTASQSSTFLFDGADKAIDGNRDAVFSCSGTLPGFSHWWSLSLPNMYRISSVTITNKFDLFYRMTDVKILVGKFGDDNGNVNPTCAVISSIPSAGTQTFDCGGMIGRFVNLKLDTINPLAALMVCEVEVYGELVVLAPSFSAVVMGRNVAVVEKKLCWSDALFYCRDFYWDLLSVRNEEEQMELEEALNTVSFPLTQHVWFGRRRYLMAGTWFWMSGASETYDYWKRQSVWSETSPCGAIATDAPFKWNDIPCGEHLHFICLTGVFFQVWLLADFTAASPPNVALSGTASQSSTFLFDGADKAIDGNRDAVFSCSGTLPGFSHWWSLSLPNMYRISSVTITNKFDLFYRMTDVKILVGKFGDDNGNVNPTCAVISSIPSAGTQTFDCGGMIGRFVNLKLDTINPLAALMVCEVEVYGELVVLAPSFSAVVMGRNVAVVEKKLCWSDALFYCRDFYWDLLSVRNEEEQMELEEALNTVSFPLTQHVWFGRRRYLMAGTWFWMSGASETYDYWKRQSVWSETSPCGAIATDAPFKWNDIPCGEHLHFICLTDFQDDKKRVEFYSSTRPFTQLSP